MASLRKQPTRRDVRAPASSHAANAAHSAKAPQRTRRQALAFAFLLGIALLSLAGVLAFSCTPHGNDAARDTWTCPYDWSGLSWANGRLSYSQNGAAASQLGVDVSDHQGTIDWDAVAADGIDFAIVRLGNRGYTEGGLFADQLYAQNLDGAAAAGLETGAYFFSQATSAAEGREEADFVLQLLAGRHIDLPIAFDHETVSSASGRANDLDSATLTAAALAFCQRLEAAGYDTMIYGNGSDMARYDFAQLGNRPRWLAEYEVTVPTARFDYALWQYSSTATVAGIATSADINLRFTNAL